MEGWKDETVKDRRKGGGKAGRKRREAGGGVAGPTEGEAHRPDHLQ